MLLIEDLIYQNKSKIQEWLNSKLKNSEIFYTSCDIRYAGFKTSQVDSNCFPAGFNNLSSNEIAKATNLYKAKFRQDNIKKVLIYPEFHTRNIGYLKNLVSIYNILLEAGADVKIAANQDQSFKINLEDGSFISYDAIEKNDNNIQVKNSNFIPDLIVLNNDLSKEYPEILKNIQTPILNSPYLGWWNRLKTIHCKAYSSIVSEFAQTFKIDPWLLDCYFDSIHNIDFKNSQHESILNQKIHSLYSKILQKYQEYSISKKPTVFIKSDKGTYGMGIHVLKNPEDGLNLNKNVRKKMDIIKDGVKNTNIIIQEGVETTLTQNNQFIEPVVYSVLSKPVGTFFRMNNGDATSNLNAKGMKFIKSYDLTEKQKFLFHLISSFANIATANELKLT